MKHDHIHSQFLSHASFPVFSPTQPWSPICVPYFKCSLLKPSNDALTCIDRGHPLDHGKSSSGHTLKNWFFPLPQHPSTTNSSLVRDGAWSTSPIYAGTLAGLIFCSSWANNHSWYEFMNVMTVSSQKFAFCSSVSSSGSYVLSTFFFAMFFVPWW